MTQILLTTVNHAKTETSFYKDKEYRKQYIKAIDEGGNLFSIVVADPAIDSIKQFAQIVLTTDKPFKHISCLELEIQNGQYKNRYGDINCVKINQNPDYDNFPKLSLTPTNK